MDDTLITNDNSNASYILNAGELPNNRAFSIQDYINFMAYEPQHDTGQYPPKLLSGSSFLSDTSQSSRSTSVLDDARRSSQCQATTPDTGQMANNGVALILNTTTNEERKQRRKQQNRLAQEKYREKQHRVLEDALQRIKVLEAELKTVKSQKEHFRLLYEELETHLLSARLA